MFRSTDVAFNRPIVGCSLGRDGRYVAIAVPRYDPELDARPLEVWFRDLEGEGGWERVPGLDASEPMSQPVVSPDGRHLSVLTAEDGSQVLLIYELADMGRAPRRLSGLPLRVEAPKWCEGSGALMCLGYDAEGWRRVWRWDSLEGEAEPCTPQGVHAGDFTPHPSGREIGRAHV